MLVVATGLAVLIGAVLGMLGGGGSVLMVPVLLYLVGLKPKTALATSQILLTVTSAVAVLVHIRARRVVWSTGVLFGTASMLGAYCGGRAACYVPAQLLLLGFTGLMLLRAAQMLRGCPQGSAPGEAGHRASGLSGRFAAIGFLTGLLAGTGRGDGARQHRRRAPVAAAAGGALATAFRRPAPGGGAVHAPAESINRSLRRGPGALEVGGR